MGRPRQTFRVQPGLGAVAWSPRHQKELASPSLEKPSMHMARPLISPVTDTSPESPWTTDNQGLCPNGDDK